MRMAEKKRRALISYRDIHLSFGDRMILADLSFDIQLGEFVFFVGHTGAGKSTILKLLYADYKPMKGEILMENFRVTSLSDKKIPFLRRKMGIVFQDFQLLPDRSVSENIRFALRATGWTDRAKIKNRISEVLIQVGLSNKAQSMPHQLSGGEQQRASIARALINYPLVLIADEPTGNLDPEATHNIMDILTKINLSGTTVLMATHEYGLIRQYPSRVIEVANARIWDYPNAHDFFEKLKSNRF